MKAVVFEEKNVVRVCELPYPKPAPGEVTVRVRAAGLCGTDSHILDGSYPAVYPIIAGHEFAGVIEEVGEGVTRWAVGEHVTVEPNFYCGYCEHCQSNRANMCQNGGAIGVTRHGAFAEYVSVPENNLYALPDAISFEEGAFVEPLACVVYAMSRLSLRFGDRALILGAGPMGLTMLKAIMAGGSAEAVCLDVSEQRLAVAKAIGAHRTCRSFEELGAKYDVVIDATGNPAVIEKMFAYAGKRARILQFGCAPSAARITISPFEIYDNDWEIIGTRATCLTVPRAIELLKNRVITGEHIINDVIGLDDLPRYLNGERPKESLKVIIRP